MSYYNLLIDTKKEIMRDLTKVTSSVISSKSLNDLSVDKQLDTFLASAENYVQILNQYGHVILVHYIGLNKGYLTYSEINSNEVKTIDLNEVTFDGLIELTRITNI